MKAAIVELERALHVAETNEPINRSEGNEAQADLEASNAADYRQALAVLNAANNGPIWPQPVNARPKVRGVSRVEDNPKALMLALDEVPSDDDMRAVQEALRCSPAATAPD